MPTLAWRDDADGFAFANSWALDSTEREALVSLVRLIFPSVVPIITALNPDPLLPIVLQEILTTYIHVDSQITYGLCGGMAYASLDYWRARLPIPSGTNNADQPSRTSPVSAPVRAMIWQRLLDSLDDSRNGGHVLRRMIEWSLLLNHVPHWLGGGSEALHERTKLEWTKVKDFIDSGTPWPIALVFQNENIWDNHQILAYGYLDHHDGTGQLLVYDNNTTQQYGSTAQYAIHLDFRDASLVASFPYTSLPLYQFQYSRLAGFFCADYTPVIPPAGLERGFGKFRIWNKDRHQWLVTDGVRLPIAAGELTMLGGTAADIRGTNNVLPSNTVSRPRDYALLRERSDPHVYLYQGGAPFWIPTPQILQHFGGWGPVRVVPDGTLIAFKGLPDEGTLLREWSSTKIYRIMSGQRRWVTTRSELAKYGSLIDVRIVPDGALASIPEGNILPAAAPGECAKLKAQITRLNTSIKTYEKQLDVATSQKEEAKILHNLKIAQTQKATAEARAAVLGCQ